MNARTSTVNLQLLTLSQVCKLTKLRRATVISYIDDDLLDAIVISKGGRTRYRISCDALDRFYKRLSKQPNVRRGQNKKLRSVKRFD